MADREFHRGGAALAGMVKRPAHFRRILIELSAKFPNLWTEFASSEVMRFRMASRSKDLIRWMSDDKDLASNVFGYLELLDKHLLPAWAQFQKGKSTADDFYDLFQRIRPQKLLQLLLFLDINIELRHPYGKAAEFRETVAPLVDAAA